MRTPSVLTCDLCGAVIKDEQRRIRLHVPMTADLVARVQAEMTATPRAPGAILNLVNMAMIPSHWEIDVCGCLLGLLPMLPDIVARDVQRVLKEKQDERATAAAPLNRLEDL